MGSSRDVKMMAGRDFLAFADSLWKAHPAVGLLCGICRLDSERPLRLRVGQDWRTWTETGPETVRHLPQKH